MRQTDTKRIEEAMYKHLVYLDYLYTIMENERFSSLADLLLYFERKRKRLHRLLKCLEKRKPGEPGHSF